MTFLYDLQWSRTCYQLLLAFLLFTMAKEAAKGQNLVSHYLPMTSTTVILTDDVSIPATSAGYSLWLPDIKTEGVILFFHSRKDTSSEFIVEYANSLGIAVMYVTTENPLEFLFSVESREKLSSLLNHALESKSLPRDKIMICGMSLAGTRALIMTRHGQSHETAYPFVPLAVAICDAPLDMIRFFRSTRRAERLNHHPAAANEGAWVSRHLFNNLKGTPKDQPENYAAYTVYSFDHREQLDIEYLDGIHVRAYTEPDVQWWINTRRKDYYDMNAVDMAGLINELMIRGHQKTRLITTVGKGYRPDGTKHPHSWNIVDEKELVDWFVNLVK